MQSIHDFCSTTTIHGVYQIRFLKYRTSKVFFLLAVTMGAYIAASQMIGLITTFLENPISTSVKIVSMNKQMANNFYLTTCVFNWISKPRAIKANYTANDIAAILSVMQPVPRFNRSVMPSNEMLDKLRSTTRKQLINIIKSIMKPYATKTNSNIHVGNAGDICFDLKAASEPIYSSAGALKSIFMLPLFQQQGHEIQESQYSPDGYVQWILYNLYDGALPFLLPEHNKLRNASVNNVVQTVEIVHFKTTGNCIPNADDKYVLPNGYITRLCTQKCIAEYVTKAQFNCSIPAFSNLDENVCILPDLVPGYLERSFFEHYNQWQRNQSFAVDKCIADQKCEQVDVCSTWKLESETIRQDRRFHNGVDGITFVMQFRDNVETVEIYSLYTWEAMISNIGGQAGLWLGASMISILHLVYSIAESIYELFTNNSTAVSSKSIII